MEINYDNWKIVKKLGSGSFSSVYEIEREDFGVYKAALKVISIPQVPEEVDDIRISGMSDQSISEYYSSMAKEIVNEFTLMSKLKGMTNIVSYEDHKVIPHEDGIGFDIYIRMELLTPLDKYILDHPLDEKEIARLGIDICRALERCQRLNIIHRDIKPANIFVSAQGDFKLGDFGISRTLDHSVSNMSRKGTTNYMAPEVYNGYEYGLTVDIYSLGLVMYRLLNHNRMPFLPPYPDPIKFQDQELAHIKRISGTDLPYPNNEVTPLGDVILKASAFDSKDRFQTPSDFRHALEQITEDSVYLNDCLNPETEKQEADSEKSRPEKKKRTLVLLLAAAAVVIILVLLILFLPKSKKTPTADPPQTATVTPETTPDKNVQENFVTIPAFKNLPQKEISNQLEALGLSIQQKKLDFVKGVSVGNVTKLSLVHSPEEGNSEELTELEEGDLVEKNSSLILFVCGIPLPDISGKTEAEAEESLTELGLKVADVTYTINDTVAYGAVISVLDENGTVLKKGDILKKNAPLTLLVSAGPYIAPSPDPVYTEPVNPETQPAQDSNEF